MLEAARPGGLPLFTSLALLAEIDEVLQRPKFAQRLSLAAVTSRELVVGYAALASVIQPATITPIVLDDPDDDADLACALAARADVFVSGDSHLLVLQDYCGTPILTAAQLLSKLGI